MSWRSAKWWLAVNVALVAVFGVIGTPHAETLLIIAHRDTPVDHLGREDLARIFLLKRARWPDGSSIVPVNREASSRLRALFSRHVLGKSVRALSGYWNQMRYRGYMPPVVQESDQAVVAFVAHVPGAVGYVRADSVKLPPQVRVLGRIEIGEDKDGLSQGATGTDGAEEGTR